MTYRPDVPVESNLVRGVSGDLTLMQGNFADLAPLVSAYSISGTTPSAALLGFVYGASGFRAVVSGSDFRIDRFSGGSWQPLLVFGNGAVDIQAARAVSGQTPTLAQHLATKGYVDSVTVSGLSGDATGAVSGDLLRFDGTDWGPGRTRVDQLADAAIVSPVSGQALVYDGTQWVNDTVSGGGGSATLSGLTDVALTAPAPGDILTLSGDGVTWVDGPYDRGTFSLADGTRPFTGPVSGVTPTQAAHLATKAYVDALSGLSISGATNLPDLLDVSDTATSSAVSGEVLTFDGTEWTNAAPTGGASIDILQVQVFS